MPVDKKKVAIAVTVGVLAAALIVVPTVLWAVTTSKGTAKTTCASDSDCQGHGVCVNSACKCNSPWGGPFCNVLGDLKDASITAGQGISCSQVPTPCKTDDDCSVCTQDVTYSCQTMSATQNQKGLAGSFCLPVPPSNSCYTGVDTANSIPGFVTWQGWADVEVQDWTCACEFPNFYPLTQGSTSNGQNTDACIKSPQVCQKGTWSYPCIRDPKNPQACLNTPCSPGETCADPNQKCTQVTGNEYVCQLPADTCSTVSDCRGCDPSKFPVCTKDNDKNCYTPDQITALCGVGCVAGTCQKTCKVPGDCGDYPCVGGYCVTSPSTLVGSNPFEYGMCDCSSQSCTTSADCAGDCFKGQCVNQRVAMDPKTGVPTCVRDTCAPGGQFRVVNIPPYTYGYCECGSGYAAQGNTCVYQGSVAPSVYCALGCGHGTCAAPGKCKCDSGWDGNATCTKYSCDKGCGNGICIGPNTCACDPGYTTDANGSCTVLLCPNNCSGSNGTCVKSPTGAPTCQCNPGWSGPTCSTPVSNSCSITLQREDSSVTKGACVTSSGTCSDADPTVTNSCTGVYFGNTTSFNSSGRCLGSCTQGTQSPEVAGLPPLLCTSSTSGTSSTTAPCTTTTCNNTPVPLETCMQNATYPYNCADLCSAFTTLQQYDYNTICKKQPAPTKPAFC